MDQKQRMEMFILIKEKMDEVVDIVNKYDAGQEFLATYCFGLIIDEDLKEEDCTYEFLAGFNACQEDEMESMFDAMHRCYVDNSVDDDEPGTDNIDYWLNLN